MKKNTTKVLKEANKYLVMQCVLAYEPITVEELIAKTSLSRPTVLEVIKNFLEEGYIVKNGYSQSTGGRPAELICINKESKYAIGIDFEFPKVRIAVANIKNEVVMNRTIKFTLSSEAAEVLEKLLYGIEELVREAEIPFDRIAGIGLGISGTINKTQGKSLHIKRIKGWDYIDIKGLLEERFQVPVYMKNDVHLLALVEKQKYLPAGIKDFAYIGIRSGIGSAIFCHNRPLDGISGNAGYIGHTILNADGPECVCGSRGCLDAYSGEIAMNKNYRKMKSGRINNEGAEERSEEEKYYTVSDFIEMAQAGDEDCIELLEQSAHYLGIAISNLVKTIEVDTIIIGGCRNLNGSIFEKTVTQTMEEYLANDMELNVKLYIGQLKTEEYSLGASCYVFDHLFEKPHLSLAVE